MNPSKFTFADLEKRINEMPDGPASVLNSPSWILTWNVFGTLGIVLGLLPSLLIHWFEPAQWMVGMSRGGLWLALIGYLPGFVRNIWVIARSMWRWRAEQTEQLDHDYVEFDKLAVELGNHPAQEITRRLRFVRLVQTRLSTKLGFLAGATEKLGVLPLLAALGLQLKLYSEPLTVPQWQVVTGLFIAVAYLMAMTGSLMRIRMQLYELILEEAQARRHEAKQ